MLAAHAALMQPASPALQHRLRGAAGVSAREGLFVELSRAFMSPWRCLTSAGSTDTMDSCSCEAWTRAQGRGRQNDGETESSRCCGSSYLLETRTQDLRGGLCVMDERRRVSNWRRCTESARPGTCLLSASPPSASPSCASPPSPPRPARHQARQRCASAACPVSGWGGRGGAGTALQRNL